MTDFRALCAQFVELWDADCDTDVEINELLVELRDALAEPEPSLKEQALDTLNLMLMFLPPGDQREQGETIRRALEQLDD